MNFLNLNENKIGQRTLLPDFTRYCLGSRLEDKKLNKLVNLSFEEEIEYFLQTKVCLDNTMVAH